VLLIETFRERDRGLVLADFSKDLSLSLSLFSSVCLSLLPPCAEVKALSLSRARLKERERERERMNAGTQFSLSLFCEEEPPQHGAPEKELRLKP
jgi:hypothetical protein